MSQNFGTPIDLKGNVIKNAGLDVVSALPTTFLVEGREVIYQGEVFRYLNGKWHINSFSAYSLKTYAELKALKDNNALVPGNQYVLTDFYTTYLAEDGETWLGAPDCEVIDHLGNPIISDNYHILLQVTSENTFSPQVYIFNQPDSDKPYLKRMSEWIVYFDFDLDLFGRIIYMNDVKYNNIFDFDIFNIRWAWKGYLVDRYVTSYDRTLLGGYVEPTADYYLWTIGDFGGCFQSLHDIYTLVPELVRNTLTGVTNTKILQSKKIFIWVQGKTSPLVTNYNYYLSRGNNISIVNSTNISMGFESNGFSIFDSSDLYFQNELSICNITSAKNILSHGRSRGLSLGSPTQFNESCKYLTFFSSGSAYVKNSIFLAEYSCFFTSYAAPTILQYLLLGYPRIRRFSFISHNTNGIGGTNVTLNCLYSQDSILEVPKLNKGIVIKSNYFYNRRLVIPTDIDTYSPKTNIELNTSENNTYLNYVNPQNEPVRTSVDTAVIIDTVDVIFHEDFLRSSSRTYFMPFISLIENPTAWGYEIEGVQYPTHEIFPVLASVFCNSGSITTQFAGKRLKFYVTSGGTTFYSSEYTINSNGTITVVK